MAPIGIKISICTPMNVFLTMVAAAAKVPGSFVEYMNPAVSTLNPYNLNFSFYVYGTLPVTLNKLVVHGSAFDTYDGIAIVGRRLSALADMGTLLLVMVIAHMLVKIYSLDKRIPYISGLLYAVAVLPIQNAHFFTVDSFLTFFVTLSFACALRARFGFPLIFVALAGSAFGLAMASKVSAIYAAPLIAGTLAYGAMVSYKAASAVRKLQTMLEWVLACALFAVVAYTMLRVGDPRMFATNEFF
ncbi:MAG: hypothetical protein UZ22_OP11002000832 [Microgenomates bacterium OLB23]|nr:MAG: hypothetical protein UZ22_OP11002000832 [Microgenomates bacterium OLB23]